MKKPQMILPDIDELKENLEELNDLLFMYLDTEFADDLDDRRKKIKAVKFLQSVVSY